MMKNTGNPVDFLNAAAGRIRAVREKLGLKQVDFAKQLGVSQSFLSFVEAGSRKPSPHLLYALLIVFDVDLHWIFTGKGDMFNREKGLPHQGAGLADIFPGVPLETGVVELVESLEVPVMRNALLAKFYLYRVRYKEIIRDYYREKKKQQLTQARGSKKK